MKRAVLGFGALLAAAAVFANEPADEDTKVAAVDADSAAFAQLDADTDGRVSAIEASNDVKIAAAFTTADGDKDGYLSKEEFNTIVRAEGSTEAGAEPEATESESQDDSETAQQPQQ